MTMERKKIVLPQSDDALLQECQVTAFRSSGAGGQHVNKTDSAVRLVHLPSGLVTTSQTERSQYLNKQECIRKLRKAVERLNYRKPKRIPTKMSRGVKVRNLEKKAKHSEKKRNRKIPKD